jgi:hypothetical protein
VWAKIQRNYVLKLLNLFSQSALKTIGMPLVLKKQENFQRVMTNFLI